MKPKTPKPLKNGHENLYADIEDIVAFDGLIGEKARELADILHPHFKKEEEFVLPPLSLLLALSEGNWEIDSETAIEMANKLQVKLTEMQNEHDYINSILVKLREIALKESNQKVIRFANDLVLHVEIEDQVLYPATILIGNYLKNTNPGKN